MTTQTLSITFAIPLLQHQLAQWRGAIAEHAGWDDEVFHNHIGAKERVHYRFPMVCYRVKNGNAALWALGEGVEAVQDMILRSNGGLLMARKAYPLRVADFQLQQHTLTMPQNTQPYFIKNWLALNDENFKKWDTLPTLTARTTLLEQILASNIIAFAKAIHWQLPQRLEVALVQIRATHTVLHKNIPMVALDVSFIANIDLPEGVGLGKAISHGFGVVSHLKEQRVRNNLTIKNAKKSQQLDTV
jgi:Cas6b C-terminal domain/Cas6b N-terminal domain